MIMNVRGVLECRREFKSYPSNIRLYHSLTRTQVHLWCDRVLWRIRDANRFSVHVKEYDLVRFPLSDHMPVRARFRVKVQSRTEKLKTNSPVSEMIASPKTTTMNRFMMRRKRRATMQDVYADTNLVQISRSKTLIKQGHLYTDHGNNKSSIWSQKYFILTRRHLIFKDDAEDDVTLKTRSFPILECEPFKVRWKGQIRIPLSRTISKMMYAASIHWTKSKSFTKSRRNYVLRPRTRKH